jgi:hypothetical protein
MGIPNLCANPSIVSVQNGPWSSPSTWSLGRVPTTGDCVWVSSNTTVTYDAVSNAALDCLGIQAGAALTFRTDINTRLTVGTMMIMPNGTLDVGTTAQPISPNVTANIVIADQAINLAVDPDQYGTGILGFGNVSMVGATKDSFVALATAPQAGDTTLTLAQPVTGWQPGDRLVLPDSRQVYGGVDIPFSQMEWETPTIQSISGTTVTLTQPLLYNHPGAVDASGTVRYLPDVGDLTRNILINSANPAGTRGHILMTGQANVDIEYVQIRDMGRSLITSPVDQATRDASGNIVSYATNQIGRYPLHMHHLDGPAQPQADGYEFTLIGNAIDGGDAPNPQKWGIDIHASSNGLIQNNIVYNTSGAGFSTEDGSESYNVFNHNFAVRTDGLGDTSYARISAGTPVVDFGHAGDGFWFQGPNNIVTNNVAADSRESGFDYYSSEFGLQDYHVPLYPGADPMTSGQYQDILNGQMPFGTFSNNESYTAAKSGLFSHFSWGVATPVVYNGMITWNSKSGYVNDFAPTQVTLKNFVVIGTAARAASYDYGYNPSFGLNFQGLGGSGAVAADTTVEGADIENVGVGIIAPTNTVYDPMYLVNQAIVSGQPVALPGGTVKVGAVDSPGTFRVDDITFRNNPTDILVSNSFPSVDQAQLYGGRQVIISNSSFSHTPVPGYQAISTQLGIAPGGGDRAWDYRDLQQVLVYGFDRTAGDNFQVFFPQQDPSFVMPQSQYVVIGSPDAGLTNQQNWAKYGIAIGGEVTPSDATTMPGILGSVAPIRPIPVADTTPPVISGLTVSGVAANGTVTVSWQTDKPTDTQLFKQAVVPYVSGIGSVVPQSYVYTTSHQVVVSGIDPNVAYSFTVVARDPAGLYSTSSANSGRTRPPVVSNISATSSSLTTITISWTTDEASSTTLEYGLTSSYGLSVTGDSGTAHSVTLAGLQPFTLYHYHVISRDSFGNQTVSADATFQTGSQYWVVETTDPGYSETGPADSWGSGQTWFGSTISKWFFNWNSSAQPGVVATWSFGNLPAGQYQVYTTWNSGNAATQVPYTISDGQGIAGTAIVNQQQWPGGFWYEGESLAQIGNFSLRGGSVTVTMAAASQALSKTTAGTMILVRVG